MEEKPQLKSLGNDLSVVENIQFDIDEVIKGSFNREFVEFRLTVVKPRDLHGEVEGKSRVDDFEKIEQSFYDLERSYEKGSVGEAQYLNRLNVLNENLLDVVDRSSGKVFLVPVKVGGLDNFYREVNVPVKLGREYYVFIFRGFSEGVLFPWDLDVYPVEKYKAWIPAYSN